MRFGGEIDHRKKLVLAHERLELAAVRDIGLAELVAFAVLLGDAGQVGGIAGVSERVQIGDVSLRVMLEHVPNEIAADETAAAGDEESHKKGSAI